MGDSGSDYADDGLEDCPELDDSFFDSICHTYDEVDNPDLPSEDPQPVPKPSPSFLPLLEYARSSSTGSQISVEQEYPRSTQAVTPESHGSVSSSFPESSTSRDPRLRNANNSSVPDEDRCLPPKPSRFEPQGRPALKIRSPNFDNPRQHQNSGHSSNGQRNFNKSNLNNLKPHQLQVENLRKYFLEYGTEKNFERYQQVKVMHNTKFSQTDPDLVNSGGFDVSLGCDVIENMTDYQRNALMEFCRAFNLRNSQFYPLHDDFSEGRDEPGAKRPRMSDFGGSMLESLPTQAFPPLKTIKVEAATQTPGALVDLPLPPPPQSLLAPAILGRNPSPRRQSSSPPPEIPPPPSISGQPTVKPKDPMRFLKTPDPHLPPEQFSSEELLTLALVPIFYPSQIINQQHHITIEKLLQRMLNCGALPGGAIHRTADRAGTFLMVCTSLEAMAHLQNLLSEGDLFAGNCPKSVCVKYTDVNFAIPLALFYPLEFVQFKYAKLMVKDLLDIEVDTWRIYSVRQLKGTGTLFCFIEDAGLAWQLVKGPHNKNFTIPDVYKRGRVCTMEAFENRKSHEMKRRQVKRDKREERWGDFRKKWGSNANVGNHERNC